MSSELAAIRPLAAVVLAERMTVAQRLVRNPVAMSGIVVVLIVAAAGIAAQVLPLQDPLAVETGQRLTGPSAGYPLGRDELGRDLLSRLVWGARVSLAAGIGSVTLSMVVGVALGLVGGYFRGVLDEIIMRLLDIVLAFPPILLAVAIVAGLGPGLTNAMLAVAIVGIPLYARLVRGMVLSARELDYVQAARTLGAGSSRILLRHVFPNVVAPVIVAASLDVGAKIIATASLSFLGLGTQPPQPDWGNMLADGRKYVTIAPQVAALPGFAIFLVVLGFNLAGDGLRDALDPRTFFRRSGGRND